MAQIQYQQLSEEQKDFVNKALSGKNVLVDACIGSGKTTAIQALCDLYPTDKSILYLTYNKLLKLDAKEKIRNGNVFVQNYHGFAYWCLAKEAGRCIDRTKKEQLQKSLSRNDLLSNFLKYSPNIPRQFDILIIDEYQDIEEKIADLLEYIKARNEGIQIVAVGDMEQKIYDKTTLKVEPFIQSFLGVHERIYFTQCFRLSKDHASMLGRIWHKTINGVNDNCKVLWLNEREIVPYIAKQKNEDVLCLGKKSGTMTRCLNTLESRFPDRFNKSTVYATIRDDDADGNISPSARHSIFTTFDGSKGLERRICVIFDFDESYWYVRSSQSMTKYEILRNIFLVAASRGKEEIVFVTCDDYKPLSEKVLSKSFEEKQSFEPFNISDMFDFKFVEDVDECFACLEVIEADRERSVISIETADEMIDLSPCIGMYQEATFFNKYRMEDAFNEQYVRLSRQRIIPKYGYRANDDEQINILRYMANETGQNRYAEQAKKRYVSKSQLAEIHQRLSSVFEADERCQEECQLRFYPTVKNKKVQIEINGIADVIKEDVVFELKFTSELSKVHYLQLAMYLLSFKLEKGILWNVKTNQMALVSIKDRTDFSRKVIKCITKGLISLK